MHALADFRATLDRLAARDEFTGSVLVTAGDERMLAAAYGYANRACRTPCALDTRFDTASVTKLFTAVAALQQVERGAFTLDTSAIGYLGLTGTTISPDVTAYHLLTHTSGIADDADELDGERFEDLFVAEPTYAFTEAAHHLPHFATKPPRFAPGDGCRYCNAGYILLGLMVERAAGSPYREYVHANVFARAGMTRSAFLRMDVVEPDVAEGVEAIRDGDGRVTGWRRNIFSYPPVGDPAGGAYTTVGDLTAFHRALVEGRLLGPESTAAMLIPYAKAEGYRRQGYGLEFRLDAEGRIRHYEKQGVNVGVSALLRHYPRNGVTLAMLGVGEGTIWPLVKLFDTLLP
ncbi:serine hydrolase domain-containing protein [Actinomycetes bacterium KLBMP 9797]